jgi:hypothetical protein
MQREKVRGIERGRETERARGRARARESDIQTDRGGNGWGKKSARRRGGRARGSAIKRKLQSK